MVKKWSVDRVWAVLLEEVAWRESSGKASVWSVCSWN